MWPICIPPQAASSEWMELGVPIALKAVFISRAAVKKDYKVDGLKQ